MAKHAGGRPPLYSDEKELELKMDEYFEACKPEYAKDSDGVIITTQKGAIVLNLNAPSLSGLALFLGYESRQSLYDNEKTEKFSYIIKRARTKVEEWVYQHSLDGSIPPAVGIFTLKQFGWTDKQEIDINDVKAPDMSKYTTEELKTLAEINRRHKS